MKKIILMTVLLATATWATDFSQLSTQELMNMRSSISTVERPAFKVEMQKRIRVMSPQQRQQMMQRRSKGGMRKKGMRKRAGFSSFDANGDGKLSQKEFYDAQAAHMTQKANEGRPMKNAGNAPTFEMIDTNKDGSISEVEFSTFRQKKMQQMRQKKGV